MARVYHIKLTLNWINIYWKRYTYLGNHEHGRTQIPFTNGITILDNLALCLDPRNIKNLILTLGPGGEGDFWYSFKFAGAIKPVPVAV